MTILLTVFKKKKPVILLLVLLFTLRSYSQSTTITPGTILPQLTTSQRTSLSNPVNGMLVFDISTQSYWFRQNSIWAELPANNYWRLEGIAGNELKNTNSGGLWSSNIVGLTEFSNNTTHPPTAPFAGNGTHMMWIPSRSAFRAGTVDSGTKAWDADSIGLFTTALGFNTKATGLYSTAIGFYSKALGISSTAMGRFSIASGSYSTAMGRTCIASGNYSTAMGFNTKPSGEISTAFGYATKASGYASTSMGQETIASGSFSTSTGYRTTASGSFSTAMGTLVTTNNYQGSFVIGDYITDAEGYGGDTLSADADDRFLARFSNGYKLYTNSDLSSSNKYGVFMNSNANSWSSISDSTRKERFLQYNPEKTLKSVAEMRIGTWNYKGDTSTNSRHWGVMAQDFYNHFGKDRYGTIGCDTLIASADFDGVTFAAIKALELRTRELMEENVHLKSELIFQKNQIQTQVQVQNQLNTKLKKQNQELFFILSAQTIKIEKIEVLKEEIEQLRLMILASKEIVLQKE
jgi:Head domain of trimeric autotransporter adhesin/Chaperone of endosialidase